MRRDVHFQPSSLFNNMRFSHILGTGKCSILKRIYEGGFLYPVATMVICKRFADDEPRFLTSDSLFLRLAGP